MWFLMFLWQIYPPHLMTWFDKHNCTIQSYKLTQIARFTWTTVHMGPPGSCRPQVGPFWAPWTLLSGDTWIQRRLNSIAPERCGSNSDSAISKYLLQIKFMSISYKKKLLSGECHRRLLMDDKTTLVQVHVIAWCRRATSHYLRQWWPRSM